MTRTCAIVSVCMSTLVLGLGCGPSAGDTTSDSASGSSSTPSSTSPSPTGPTATGPSSATVDSTGSQTTTSTTSTTTGPPGTSDDTGPGVDCSNAAPAEVPDPPDGCEHVYLLGPDGLPDLSRPSGYWLCDPPDGATIYRVAAVPCHCDFHHPLCRDGDETDCNGQACGAGETCIDYFGNGLCGCQGLCTQDSDCGRGEACMCGARTETLEVLGSVNRCVPADCTAGDDCGSEDCKVAQDICYVPESLRCSTASDDCATHADCMTNYCRWDEVEELWTCDQAAVCE